MHEPALRHALHPRADHGDQLARPEQAEMPVPERAKAEGERSAQGRGLHEANAITAAAGASWMRGRGPALESEARVSVLAPDVVHDFEHQTGARGRVARAGLEPEQQRGAQPL